MLKLAKNGTGGLSDRLNNSYGYTIIFISTAKGFYRNLLVPSLLDNQPCGSSLMGLGLFKIYKGVLRKNGVLFCFLPPVTQQLLCFLLRYMVQKRYYQEQMAGGLNKQPRPSNPLARETR